MKSIKRYEIFAQSHQIETFILSHVIRILIVNCAFKEQKVFYTNILIDIYLLKYAHLVETYEIYSTTVFMASGDDDLMFTCCEASQVADFGLESDLKIITAVVERFAAAGAVLIHSRATVNHLIDALLTVILCLSI